MTELYRLVEGQLILKNIIEPFQFGFVYDDNGKIYLEIYFNEKSKNLNAIWHNVTNEIIITTDIQIKAVTEKNHKITVLNLNPTRFSNGKPVKGTFRCHDKLIYEKDLFVEGDKVPPIYFIELEGLNIAHTDVTERKKISAGSHRNQETLPNLKRDFTTFSINLLNGNRHPTYWGEIYDHPNPSNNNQVLYFKDFLPVDIFEQNKEYLVQMLSLLNGADVRIRRIFTGQSYITSDSSDEPNSHITEIFSFPKINNQGASDYIPVYNRFKRSGNELMSAFLRYENFIEEYNKLDFKSVIFYLNRANENENLEQRIFTLIIALEELSSKYLKEYNPQPYTIIPPDKFEKVKEELKKTFKEFKSEIPNQEFSDLLSKLCGINYQPIDTEEKFYQLFNHAGIAKSPTIIKVVKKRHFVIHEGETGNSFDEKMNFYHALDHILRDVILNRINYKGTRNKRVEL